VANSATVGILRALLTANHADFDKAYKDSTGHVEKLAAKIEKDLAPSQASVNRLMRDFLGSREIGKAQEMALAVERIGGASKLTAADQAKVNRVVAEALEHYKKLGKEAPESLLKLEQATRKIEQPLVDNTNKAKLFGVELASLKNVAGLLGVTLSAGAAIGFVKSVFDAADQVGDLATKMGVSVEATQRFQYAARQSGSDIEDVSRAIVSMNDKLASGEKSTVSALKAAGLSFHDVRMMKPEEAFRAIADAVGRIPDPMEQSRVAMELFGKSGVELLPMIREGSLAAADGVKVMSDETVAQLKDAKQSWEDFSNALIIETGEAINAVSKLDDVLKALMRTILENPFDALANFGKHLWDNFGNPTAAITAMGMEAFVNEQIKKGKADPKFIQERLKGWTGGGSDAVEIGGAVNAVWGNLGGLPTAPVRPLGRPKTKEEIEAEEAAAKKLNDEISKQRREWFGQDHARRIQVIAAALEEPGAAAMLSTKQLQDLRNELNAIWFDQKNRVKGWQLPKELEAIRTGGFLRMGPPPKEFADIIKLMESVAAGPPSNLVKWGPRKFDFDLASMPAGVNPIVTFKELGKGEFADFNRQMAQMHAHLFQDKPGAFDGVGKALRDQLKGAAERFPQLLSQAIINGQDVSEAVSALGVELGAAIGTDLGKRLGDHLSGTVGGSLGDMLGPALGGLAGLAVNWIADLTYTEGERTNDQRDVFMESIGGLEGAHKRIAAVANDPALMQAFNTLYFAGNQKTFEKGTEAFTKRWEELMGDFQAATSKSGVVWSDTVRSMVANSKELGLAQQEIDAIWQRQLDGAAAATNAITKAGATDQASLDRLSRIALVTFQSYLSQGKSGAEAIGAIGVSVDQLKAAMESMGLSSNGALDELVRYRDFASKNADLLAQASSLDDLLAAQANLGSLTVESLADLRTQGLQTYQQIRDAAVASGYDQAVAGKMALKEIVPFLETVLRLHEERGLAIDDETKALIEQAKADGLLTEKKMSTNDILQTGLGRIIELLGGDLPDGWRKAADAAEESSRRMQRTTGEAADAIRKDFRDLSAIEIDARFGFGRLDGEAADALRARIEGLGGAGIDAQFGFGQFTREYEAPALPGFAEGTGGRFLDFGRGTPVMLHGRERVMTEGEGLEAPIAAGSTFIIQAVDARSFEQFLDRGGADIIARKLPAASSRYVRKR
jgi:hypothetical protein